ncbi:hypothetical protein J6590_074878 [Homalodisca vitripennis]|nr:hypothetical protein J6590_074878 [Homalodisca vitripennis]
MSNRRSSFLDPERRRFLVKRVSLAPGPDPDDEVEPQDDDDAVECPSFYARSIRRMTRE